MTDRSVRVRLLADVQQYRQAMRQAAADTATFGREVSGHGSASRAELQSIGNSALLVGAAATAGLGLAVNAAAGFEQQMSHVGAAASATAADMELLRQAALDAGRDTVFSATEAAKAQTELAKAGVSVADILGGGLAGALDLAAAGNLDLGTAAEIAASAMTTFGLAGTDVTRIADALAAGANKSAADVDDMALAMQQSGLVANQLGISMEETVGTLAMFAQSGLRGSDAGTSFKTMLQRLVPSSVEARDEMERLGIDFFDAQGQFVGLEGAAQELQDSLGHLSQEQRSAAMTTLFGSDAVRAATIFYEGGAAGVAEWTGAVSDAGYASELAEQKLDNLKGDIEALGGSIETALIQGGSRGTDTLRALAQAATTTVSGFTGLPDVVQLSAVGLTGLVGAGGLALGAVAKLGPAVAEAQATLRKMGTTGTLVANNLGNIAAGAAAVGTAFAAWSAIEGILQNARNEATEWGQEMRASVDLTGSSFEELEQKLAAVRDGQQKLIDDADSSSAPWDADYRAGLRQGAEELANLGDEVDRLVGLASGLADQFGISEQAALDFVRSQQAAGIDVLAEDYDSVASAMSGAFVATTTGTVASHELAAGMETLGSEVASVEEQVDAFTDALDALHGEMFGEEAARDALQQDINDLDEVLQDAIESGLDLNDVMGDQSDGALALRGHMRDLTSSATEVIAEWVRQGVTGADLQARIDFLSASLRDQAVAAGVPIPVVDDYLGLLREIPVSVDTTFNADTSTAMGRIAALQDSLAAVPRTVPIGFIGPLLPNQTRGAAGMVTSYAGGGIEAHITRGELLRYGEPSTGGEAFVPRLGDKERSLSILDVAAGWYGQKLIPANIFDFAEGGWTGADSGAAHVGSYHHYGAVVSELRGLREDVVRMRAVNVHASPLTDAESVRLMVGAGAAIARRSRV